MSGGLPPSHRSWVLVHLFRLAQLVKREVQRLEIVGLQAGLCLSVQRIVMPEDQGFQGLQSGAVRTLFSDRNTGALKEKDPDILDEYLDGLTAVSTEAADCRSLACTAWELPCFRAVEVQKRCITGESPSSSCETAASLRWTSRFTS